MGGRLLGLYRNDQRIKPPTDIPQKLRDWLRDNRMTPLYTKWVGSNTGSWPRSRREVYTGPMEVIDRALFAKAASTSIAPPTRSSEARRILKSGTPTERKDLAGQGAPGFQHCPDCPLLSNCPVGWDTRCERTFVENQRQVSAGDRRHQLIGGLQRVGFYG